jgi:hypothetical protein
MRQLDDRFYYQQVGAWGDVAIRYRSAMPAIRQLSITPDNFKASLPAAFPAHQSPHHQHLKIA